MNKARLPQDFDEWRYCIETLCKTPLTESFVAQRLQELGQLDNKLDKRFVELYGEEHRAQVMTWYRKVQEDGTFADE